MLVVLVAVIDALRPKPLTKRYYSGGGLCLLKKSSRRPAGALTLGQGNLARYGLQQKVGCFFVVP